MLIYILLWIFFSTVYCQGQHSISPEESLWTKSIDKCSLATPNVDAAISYNPSVFSITSRDIDIPTNEAVWVGYYQVVRGFEYIGCIKYNTLFNAETPFVTIHGDPGQCFPRCEGSSIIGVTINKCYCLGNEFKLTFKERTETRCTDLCNQPPVACGKDSDPDIYSFLSIYRVNPDVTASVISKTPPSSEEEQYCLKIDLSPPKKFYWDRCQLSFNAMCFSTAEDRIQNVKCKDTSLDFCTWTDAARTCFQKSMFPTLFSNSKTVVKGNMSQAWTGLFKTFVTYRYNANIPVQRQQDRKQYGYLLNEESKWWIKLKFTDNDSLKKVLCQDRNRNNDLTTRGTQPHTETEVTRNQTTSPTSLSGDLSTKDGASPVIYIATGAGVLVLLVAVLILLIVFIKRRRNKKNQEKTRDKVETSHQISEDHNDYPDLALPKAPQDDSHNYYTLEAGGTEENKTYDTATEDNTVYDTTKDQDLNSKKEKSENVYNQLDANTDTTYDHANVRNGSKAALSNTNAFDDTYDSRKDNDDTYDSSKAMNSIAAGHTDNIYNETGDIDDEEYSHMGSKPTQAKTDNVYGIIQLENALIKR